MVVLTDFISSIVVLVSYVHLEEALFWNCSYSSYLLDSSYIIYLSSSHRLRLTGMLDCQSIVVAMIEKEEREAEGGFWSEDFFSIYADLSSFYL